MFLLGLISGGNILKKYIDVKYHDFLTFENPKELCIEFKKYLNENVIDEEKFINIVKNSYKLIKLCFDEFYKEFL